MNAARHSILHPGAQHHHLAALSGGIDSGDEGHRGSFRMGRKRECSGCGLMVRCQGKVDDMTPLKNSCWDNKQVTLALKTWREAKSRCDARMDDAKLALKDTLQSFKTLGAALLEAHEDRASLEEAVGNAGGWISLKGLVATAEQLTDTFAELLR